MAKPKYIYAAGNNTIRKLESVNLTQVDAGTYAAPSHGWRELKIIGDKLYGIHNGTIEGRILSMEKDEDNMPHSLLTEVDVQTENTGEYIYGWSNFYNYLAYRDEKLYMDASLWDVVGESVKPGCYLLEIDLEHDNKYYERAWTKDTFSWPCINDDFDYLYFGDLNNDYIERINYPNFNNITSLSISPERLWYFNLTGGYIYAGTRDSPRSLHRIDPDGWSIEETNEFGSQIQCFHVAPDEKLYLGTWDTYYIHKMNPLTLAQEASLYIGATVHWLDSDEDYLYAAVYSSDGSRVAKISLDTFSIEKWSDRYRTAQGHARDIFTVLVGDEIPVLTPQQLSADQQVGDIKLTWEYDV